MSDWLTQLRAGGRERFQAVGLPTVKDERWRTHNPKTVAKVAWADAGTEAVADRRPALVDLPEPVGDLELVFVDGRFSAARSLEGPVAGVAVTRLAEAPSALADLVGALVPLQAADGFDAWNAAALTDGVVVDIEAGADVRSPISLVFVSTEAAGAADAPLAAHPRVIVRVRRGARAHLLERWVGRGHTLTNAVVEVHVGANAELHHTSLHAGDAAATHRQHTVAHLARDARYRRFDAALGGAWVRHDLDIALAGEGAEASTSGTLLLDGPQQVDTHLTLRHDVGHTTSKARWKSLVGDKAKGTFDGSIRIADGADGTDADLKNDNLLLSEKATLHTKPELVIFADDVKAAHGATVGALDPQQRFYLRSRGIPEAQADRILGTAFVGTLLDEVAHPEVVEVAREAVLARVAALFGDDTPTDVREEVL